MASIRERLRKPKTDAPPEPVAVLPAAPASLPEVLALDLDIAPTDPLLAYLHDHTGAVDLTRLNLESPALERLRAAAPGWSRRWSARVS